MRDVLGPDWNLCTRIIEYGGRSWLPLGDVPDAGFVLTRWDGQRMYRTTPGGPPEPIGPEPERPASVRYRDFARVGEEVRCLREETFGEHGTDAGGAAPRRQRGRISRAGAGAPPPLQDRPKPSPDGHHACRLGWDHPAMPWDGTRVMCVSVGVDGTFGPAGGGETSVVQVEWTPSARR